MIDPKPETIATLVQCLRGGGSLVAGLRWVHGVHGPTERLRLNAWVRALILASQEAPHHPHHPHPPERSTT